MNRSLSLVAALALTSIAGTASALDVNVDRALVVPGLTSIPDVATDVLGFTHFTALGATSSGGRRACQYLMEWTSAFNPNDTQLCVLRERTTPFYPSCIRNRTENINTVVEAGSSSIYSTYCAGFDNLGESFDDVSLLLNEDEEDLEGLAIYEGIVPIVLPVQSIDI